MSKDTKTNIECSKCGTRNIWYNYGQDGSFDEPEQPSGLFCTNCGWETLYPLSITHAVGVNRLLEVVKRINRRIVANRNILKEILSKMEEINKLSGWKYFITLYRGKFKQLNSDYDATQREQDFLFEIQDEILEILKEINKLP